MYRFSLYWSKGYSVDHKCLLILACHALFVAVILSLVNIYSVKCTAYVTVVFSGLKLVSIAFIVIVGVLTVILRQSFPERLHQPFEPLEGHHPSIASVAVALYGVMWAYDGW